MKVLIVSDTHNNLKLYKKVLSENKADLLFHLGDYYEDSDKVRFSGYCQTLYRVPGIYHPGYRDGSLPYLENIDLLGFPVNLVHNIDDIDFSKMTNQVVFYGHTHIPKISRYKTNILINPGHLKLDEDRNQPASYIILTVTESEMIIEMHKVKDGLSKTYIINKLKDNKLELKI